MDRVSARVILGDCMRELPRLEAGAAQLVIADPPYGIDYTNGRGESIANDDSPYIWWMREAWRLTAEGGAMVCFCRWDVQEFFRSAASAAGFRVRSQLVWDKENHGKGDCLRSFAPSHEVAWFATKGRFAFRAGRPRSVVRAKAPHHATRTHPTEKPVTLMAELIGRLTMPGELVIDPFCGTGASGVAAVHLGRRWLGIELDPTFAATARKRIKEARRERTHRTADQRTPH